MKIKLAALTAALLAIAMLDAPRASGADPGAVDEVAIEFVMNADRVTREEAVRRLEAQEGQNALADRVTRELGDLAAGAWIDRRTGELVINVLDDHAAAYVRDAGARPELVGNAMSELEALHARLDEIVESERASIGVDSWYIDVQHNVLVVKVAERADDPTAMRIIETVREAGQLGSIQPSEGQPVTTSQNVYGGTQIVSNAPCSAGFAAKDAANYRYMITASHCVWTQANVSINGLSFGQRSYVSASYDEATVLNWYPAYWLQQPYVWLYNGYFRKVSGWSQAYQNTVVCKSGIATGYTCGYVQAYGLTAKSTFSDGSVHYVYGLAAASFCVKGGDSGGPVLQGNLAQGTMTNSVLYKADGTPWVSGPGAGPQYCGYEVGKLTSAFYQPIGGTLWRAGLTLVT